MPPKQEYLTASSLKQIWEKERLPSIKKEIKAELDGIKDKIKGHSMKCTDIKRLQGYLSTEFDNFRISPND